MKLFGSLAGLAGLAALSVSPATAQSAYLKAQNSGSLDLYGDAAVAIDGDRTVVGAKNEDSGAPFAADSGAAYAYATDGTSWTADGFLKASNFDPGDVFGSAVAISGDTIVVGAPGEDSAATGVGGDEADDTAGGAGAAYVFVRASSTWSQQAYLKASNADAGDQFGVSVAISGDTIVVGASGEDSAATGVGGDETDDTAGGAGAAYVFVRSGTTWSQQAYLKASNTGVGDVFGEAVAIAGDTIVVGAFQEDSAATGVDGDGADDSLTAAGAAYVFARSGTTWSQQAYLKSSSTDAQDLFGHAVAAAGDRVVVGAPYEDSAATGVGGDDLDGSASAAGAAYVFARSGSTWSQEAYLKATNTGPGDRFAFTVAISGDTVAAGAPWEASSATGLNGDPHAEDAPGSGAAYAYRRIAGAWHPAGYAKASNTGPDDNYGRGLGISGSRLVAGAPEEDSGADQIDGNQLNDLESNAGAAYVVELPDPPATYCTAKPSSAGCVAQVTTSSPGLQPASGDGGYAVLASGVHELKNGLVFAGTAGAAAIPFSGGTLCVQPPLKRGPILGSGGGAPNGCAGSFATIVNDGVTFPAGLDAGPGNTGWYQYWYRDPANGAGTLGTALSDAVTLSFF